MDNQSSSTVRWISLSIIAAAILICGTIIYTSNGSPSTVANNNNNNVPSGQQPTGSVKVSMDDDAVLGDKNAPVTLIEFSDYECPFCKRHFTEVYPQIKKDYIDTGKVKFVFRDFIAVTAHNPLATTEALAAQCVKELGGDNAYFAFHDAVFTKTTSNGRGLAVSELPNIAKNIGVDVNKFQSCLDSKKWQSEINKDQADGTAAGVSGTPSFFVGKSTSSGTIDGTIIVGAQPYSAFQAAIDAALAK